MAEPIPLAEAARRLPDLLERLKAHHESFVIVRDGEELGRLEPAAPLSKPFTVGDLLDLLHEIGPPDASLADDLDEIRQAQPLVPTSPWES